MRLGFWPAVYGNWISSNRKGEFDASFAHARTASLTAEAAGFDTLLVAEHFSNPLGPHLDQLDAWTTAAALAAVTSRIEIIAAVKPGPRPPGVIAKMAANIDQISNGRFALNLIAAWWLREFEMLGLPVLDHDDRYARMDEFISVVAGMWRENNYSFQGKYYEAKDASIVPKPLRQPHPPIYVGGDSPAGRAFAAKHADVFLMNGRSVAEARDTVKAVSKLATDLGRKPPSFGIVGFVVCRDTPDQAGEEAQRLAALKTTLRIEGDSTMSRQSAAKSDADLAKQLGTNFGWACGLSGPPQLIADRMRAYEDAGIDTFLLQFHPLVAELQRFGDSVMPLLRP